MKHDDLAKLFDFLGRLYPGQRKSVDDETAAIWEILFRPWPYEKVRAAILARARKGENGKFYPDPAEVCIYLPKDELEAEETKKAKANGWIETHRRPSREACERMLQDLRPWHRELRGLGLPTLSETLRYGMSTKEYTQMLRDAGL